MAAERELLREHRDLAVTALLANFHATLPYARRLKEPPDYAAQMETLEEMLLLVKDLLEACVRLGQEHQERALAIMGTLDALLEAAKSKEK
jgi:hypothetical protein